jgi:hypothetical protein
VLCAVTATCCASANTCIPQPQTHAAYGALVTTGLRWQAAAAQIQVPAPLQLLQLTMQNHFCKPVKMLLQRAAQPSIAATGQRLQLPSLPPFALTRQRLSQLTPPAAVCLAVPTVHKHKRQTAMPAKVLVSKHSYCCCCHCMPCMPSTALVTTPVACSNSSSRGKQTTGCSKGSVHT